MIPRKVDPNERMNYTGCSDTLAEKIASDFLSLCNSGVSLIKYTYNDGNFQSPYILD